jgi:hypothetical protein
VRRLTHRERQALELSFTVGDGSAEAEGDGKGFLVELAKGISTMSDRHKLIALLAIAAMYFGSTGIISYLKDEHAHDVQIETMKHEERAQEILAKSMKDSFDAGRVAERAKTAFDSILHHSGNASSVTVQGAELGRAQIDEIVSSPRRTSLNIDMRQQFDIMLVDPTSKDGFVVKVRSARGEIFNAVIYDSMVSDATRRTVRNAEWSKQKVTLHITAPRLGDEIVDARVISASPVRSKKIEIADLVKRSDEFY